MIEDSKITILLVDDDSYFRNLFVRQGNLRNDFNIIPVSALVGLMAELDVSLPDVLIIDVRVPGIEKMGSRGNPAEHPTNALKCIEALNSKYNGTNIPIIVYTRYASSCEVNEELQRIRCIPNVFEIYEALPSVDELLDAALRVSFQKKSESEED